METVLITGASSGIGRELARLFAADGSRLVLVARREERLRDLAAELRQRHGVDTLVIPYDLADPRAPAALVEQLTNDGIAIDVLVNNAGFGALGCFWQLSPERQAEMVEVNIAALTKLTRLLLPGMLERGRGGVLNVASTASFQPGPYMAVYYASKAYVRFFSEALSHELRRTPVSVTCLCPGPTQTEFGEDSGMEGTFVFRFAMPVEQVAQAGHRGFRRGKLLVVPGLMNRLGVYALRLTPRWLVRIVVGKLQKPHP